MKKNCFLICSFVFLLEFTIFSYINDNQYEQGSNSELDARIKGGQFAEISEFPWAVAIQYKNSMYGDIIVVDQ